MHLSRFAPAFYTRAYVLCKAIHGSQGNCMFLQGTCSKKAIIVELWEPGLNSPVIGHLTKWKGTVKIRFLPWVLYQ